MDGAGDIQHYYAADGLDSGNWTVKHWMDSSGNSAATNSLRAPIFYDLNNTGYYVDPNSTSRIATVKANELFTSGQVRATGWWGQTTGGFTSHAAEIGASGTTAYLISYSRDTGAYGQLNIEGYGISLTSTASYVNTNYSFRAPIFYDSDNTGFYLDPASSSKVNEIYDISENSYRSYKQSQSDFPNGTLVITSIDASAVNGASVRLEAKGKSYSGLPSMSFTAEAYLYNNTFINVAGLHTGSYGFSNMVIMNYNGYIAFWWPRVSYWNSFDVAVINTSSGNSKNSVTSIINAADPTGSAKRVNIPMKMSAIYGTNHNDSLYASIVYDSNDTAYYVDPAAVSVVSRIDFGTSAQGWRNSGAHSVSGHSVSSISFDWNGNYDDATYHGIMSTSSAGAYGDNLSINSYNDVSIRLDANANNASSYFRIYNDSATNGNQLFYLDSNGTSIVSGSSRAQIFYDSNDTGYYVDPNTTGTSVNVAGSIIAGGSVGIGISPASKLHVYGTQSYGSLRLSPTSANGESAMAFYRDTAGVQTSDAWVIGHAPWGNTGDFVIGNQAGGGPLILVEQNGYTGIGNTAPQEKLHVTGNILASGNITAYSDINLKENIKPIVNAVKKVQQLNGVTYTRNDLEDTAKRYAGLIAQDIEKVLPEAVEGDDIKRVDYNATIGLLVEAIKELKTEVDNLKTQLAQKEQ